MPVPQVSVQVHPAADLFPLLTGDEFAALVTDIQEHGQREPVTLHEGKILDGRNRWRACDEIGIEPKTQEWDRQGSITAFIWSMNGPRRHLTPSQRAAIALEMLPHFEAEARARLSTAGQSAAPGRSAEKGTERFPEVSQGVPLVGEAREQAARTVGVNAHYVSDAKRIKEQAPEVFEEVRTGTKTLPAAKLEVDARSVVERYPELGPRNGVPPKYAVKIGGKLDVMPEPQRQATIEAIRRGDSTTITTLAELPPMPPEEPKQPNPEEPWAVTFRHLLACIVSVNEEGGIRAIVLKRRLAGRRELLKQVQRLKTFASEWESALTEEGVSDVA